jgi:hypothetical protein
MKRLSVAVLVATAAFTGCSSDDDATDEPSLEPSREPTREPTLEPSGEPASASSVDDRFPTIVGAESVYDDGSDTWSFAVTVSSPYDTPERYADGWRVIGPDDTVYGVHTLTHDHAGEQPFTRRQTGVVIPSDVDEVTIEGRDLANGFGGATLTLELDRSTG